MFSEDKQLWEERLEFGPCRWLVDVCMWYATSEAIGVWNYFQFVNELLRFVLSEWKIISVCTHEIKFQIHYMC